MTELPSSPSRSLLRRAGGRRGMPWGMKSILSAGHAVDGAEQRRAVLAHDDDALGQAEQLVHRGALLRVRARPGWCAAS